MSPRNIIILYIGILLIPSITQIFTVSECDITKGDCVTADERKAYYCKYSCLRTPDSCKGHIGVDLFGKEQKYQCHCKYLSDCQFRINSTCKHGCLPGYEEPYCQKRKYHEFIKNESTQYSYLFSPDNTNATKPRIVSTFQNEYRINTVEIYSNSADSTMNIVHPGGMECKQKGKKNITICTGDVEAKGLDIHGTAGIYYIKLFGCPRELYGENCIKKCNCSNGKTCHHLSGTCEGKCEDGWYGKKCNKQTYVNIAQRNTTSQTSTYGIQGTTVFDNGTCTKMNISMTSDKAVDGNYDPGFTHMSCASTDWEHNPYWEMTFDKPHMISQLRIHNRMTHRYRLSGFKVTLGSSFCFQSRNNEHSQQVIYIKCEKPVNSSNVRISLNGNKRILTLCEVEVLQCRPGFYGNMCMKPCKQLCLRSKCDEATGHCKEGCVEGYYWSDESKKCEECKEDKFGVNCQSTCHCIDNKNCNKTTGRCLDGCSAGYKGKNCQEECKEGKFGVNCQSICHCVDNKNCNRQSGRCSDGCSAGYKGDNCQEECKEGKFGVNCNSVCHCVNNTNCDREDGTCPDGCSAGYQGYNCQEEKSPVNILVVVLVALFLFILLIIGIAAAIWCWKKRTIAKPDERIRKISENRYSEAIPEDTVNLYEEIQLNESEGTYIGMVSSSFTSNPLEYVSQKKQEVEPFNDEFSTLPNTLPLPCTEATKPENAKKNRYKTILPYDHSRVKLLTDEISSSDYINASFICDKRYIACQGPTRSTKTDFWRMIWQLKCNTIIMLKYIVDKGKMKFLQYWPEEATTESFGTIQITAIGTSTQSTYIHRRFIISKPNVYQNESWTIDHFFFIKWPDHDNPNHTEYFLEFRNALKHREGITTPLVVHCSAGVGRTGTYICIDLLLNEMLSGETVDVLKCITKLREDRMHMVQKRIQLEFIYDVLVENILTGDYDIDVNDIPKEFSRIKETDHSTNVSILEHQFQDVIKQVEQSETNITSQDDGEEYANFNINAVFIDGPSCENEFLVTKTPIECKTVEFLRFLSKRGYLSILTFFDSTGEPPNYLPRRLGESVTVGPYLLKLISVEDKNICIHSVIKVECDNNSRIETFEINHFQATIWIDRNYPSMENIVNLSSVLSNHQMEQFNKKIAVHCSDNFHKSGLLCIIHILKAAIASQPVINIVRLVRMIKKKQRNIVKDCDSYAFIWEVAAYLQTESSLYYNFVQ